MILLINVAIAAFGLGAMLLAFGGDTIIDSEFSFGGDQWTTGKSASLFKRITARGWFSLLCLSIAIGLVVVKEKVMKQTALDEVVTIASLEEENTRLKQRVAKQVSDIAVLQMQVSQAGKSASELDALIETHHLKSIEAAFSLSAKPLRERDEAVVQIDGRAQIPIPSRHQEQMRLYGGDRFYFSTFIPERSETELQSIQLEVGGKPYPLFNEKISGFFERTLRLPGNPLIRESASINNPLLLDNMTIKIFIRPKGSSHKEGIFKELVLNSPFSELALKAYEVVKADMLNMRSLPMGNANLVSRLPKASFVRIVQKKPNWTEVITPDGKQGWVTSKFLGKIE